MLRGFVDWENELLLKERIVLSERTPTDQHCKHIREPGPLKTVELLLYASTLDLFGSISAIWDTFA
jgi:hypothetical protein